MSEVAVPGPRATGVSTPKELGVSWGEWKEGGDCGAQGGKELSKGFLSMG
jgi:hypothetical protein